MWRSAAFASAIWLAWSPAAFACLGTNFHRGVIFDDIPWTAPPDALVLRVEFDRTDVRRIAGPPTTDAGAEWLLMERIAVEARVIEVVRGSYDHPTVRIAIGGSSCDAPFIFGRRGLVIGSFVTPDQGQARYDAVTVNDSLRLSWPFSETIFDAETEARDDRDLRHAGLARVDGGPFISGEYDGDDRFDTARFFEDREGTLHIGVQLGAHRQDRVERIWSSDISSLPYFTFRSAPPGTYRTLCHLYGPDCGGAPREVTLNHDGIIITALEGPAEYLHYWEDGRFKDIIISE